MPDAVIIGAGYAGMSAAALLSHAGRKVVVLEESERVGGRARSFRDEEGYLREYGAHSHRLAHKGIANEVFRRLGEKIDFLPEAHDGKLIFKGRLWERPEGPIGFLKTPMLSFRARLVLLALFAKIKKTDPATWYHKTLLDFYKTSFRNPEVEAFLPFLGMTIMCPDPNKVSAGEVIDFLKRVLAAGGWGGIALVLFDGAGAQGPSGVVAPVSAVMSAVVPTIAGMTAGSALSARLAAQTSPSRCANIGLLVMISGQAINLAYNAVTEHPCLLYTSPSPRDRTRTRMPSSA